MSVTVAAVKTMLTAACGSLLTAAGFDGTAASTDWDMPIVYGLFTTGRAVADLSAPADADLSEMEQSDLPLFLLITELRALENALQNYVKVDQKIALGELKFGQVRDSLEAAIARKKRELADRSDNPLTSTTAVLFGMRIIR